MPAFLPAPGNTNLKEKHNSLPIMPLTKQYTGTSQQLSGVKSNFRNSCIQQASYLSKPNIIMICSCFKYFPKEIFILTTHLSSRAIDNLHT